MAVKNCEHEDWFGICLSCSPPDEWTYSAACKDAHPDTCFPEDENYDAAKRLCETCAVSPYCLEIGINEIHGVWGGLDPIQRDKLAKSPDLPKDRLERRKFLRVFAFTN